ncbi:carboxylesterase family protein [Paenarthrobacter nicotinovorans]|uniref:carboxylesterase family protein n=1 Tax=Paenarthrobacter nicotinovorans TaxID=29320 RepID=UPI003747D904
MTTAGRIRGAAQGPVTIFLGVPYGADTRNSRFRPPRPVESWEGVRDATPFAAACPQPAFTDDGDGATPSWLGHSVGATPLECGSTHPAIWSTINGRCLAVCTPGYMRIGRVGNAGTVSSQKVSEYRCWQRSIHLSPITGEDTQVRAHRI